MSSSQSEIVQQPTLPVTINVPAPVLKTPVLGSLLVRTLADVEGPLVRLYHSYGNGRKILVMGHALRYAPRPDDTYHSGYLRNTHSLLKLFLVKPLVKETVIVKFGNEEKELTTADDGFFSADWDINKYTATPWTEISAELKSNRMVRTESLVYMPWTTPYVFISDIDDTFLISNTHNVLRRLWTLFSHNAQTRKAFAGVAEHYKYLAALGTTANKPNPFFFVSSSEWNLYDYLKEFCRINNFPEGVFLLSSLKGLATFWKSGMTKHHAKYAKVARILSEFPDQHYVLLGDDAQRDPEIYTQIIEDFPGRVKCVYIRHRVKAHFKRTRLYEEMMKAMDVEVCYFTHSKTAEAHSRKFFTA